MEWLLAVREAQTFHDKDVAELAYSIQGPTRRLVKAQLGFHRDNAIYRWIDATRDAAAVVQDILTEFSKPHHEGACNGSGRLSKDEEYEIKRYITKLQLLNHAENVDFVRDWLVRNNIIGA
eukprot:TRINITY_DN6973_c0_g1_i2.p1 TRINITY_DN6973_c0_g1~~TRINITY_DN6973_c0_g1_i2.p1  ORF type:complete len:130 (-),score=4.14 TRINITY_DN6973_c0_g1_i2:101-463(-)